VTVYITQCDCYKALVVIIVFCANAIELGAVTLYDVALYTVIIHVL